MSTLACEQDKREDFKEVLEKWQLLTDDKGEFAEFVLSVLCDVVGQDVVKSEVTEMELYYGD